MDKGVSLYNDLNTKMQLSNENIPLCHNTTVDTLLFSFLPFLVGSAENANQDVHYTCQLRLT